MAVGLAERASAHGLAPVLLAGPEARRPRGVSDVGQRPVVAGPYGAALEALYPGGCGATASGIQGVWRLWPGFDREAVPLEPAALIITGGATAEDLAPPPENVTGVVLVVPFRDLPAHWIVEGVTRLQTMGYSLRGMVVVSARAWAPSPSTTEAEEGAGAQNPGNQGGAMEPASKKRNRVAEELEPREQPDDAAHETELENDDAPEDPAGEDGRSQVEWDHVYGPPERAPRRRFLGLPTWSWFVVLILLGALAVLASRRLSVVSNGPPTVARPAIEREAPAAPPVVTDDGAAEAATEMAMAGEAEEGAPVAAGPETESAVEPGRTTAAEPPATRVEQTRPQAPAAAPVVTPSAGQPGQTVARAAVKQAGPPYGVMVGSFQQMQRAQGEATRLSREGLEARVVPVELPGKGTWYRVVVGSWNDMAQARAAGRQAVSAGWVKSALLVTDDGRGGPIPGELK